MQCNPKHVYSQVGITEFNEMYFPEKERMLEASGRVHAANLVDWTGSGTTTNLVVVGEKWYCNSNSSLVLHAFTWSCEQTGHIYMKASPCNQRPFSRILD